MKRFTGLFALALVLCTALVSLTVAGSSADVYRVPVEQSLRRCSWLNGSPAFTDSGGGAISLPALTTSSVSCTTQAISALDLDFSTGGGGNLSTTQAALAWVTFTHTGSWSSAPDSFYVYFQGSDDGVNWATRSAVISGTATAGTKVYKVLISAQPSTSGTDVTLPGFSYVRFILSSDTGGPLYGKAMFKAFKQRGNLSIPGQ